MDKKKEIILGEKILNNPIARNLLAIYNSIIPLGEVVTTNVDIIINEFIRKKREKFIEDILNDNNLITNVDVSDVEFIMNFKKTLEAIDRLSNNDKIVYFANLLKNGYLKGERIESDKYEENLRILSELSIREIDYIFFLYQFENKNNIKDEHYWYNFISEFETEFNINKYETYEIYKRISYKGLVGEELELESGNIIKAEHKNEYDQYDRLNTGKLDLMYFYITDFLKELIKLIEK